MSWNAFIYFCRTFLPFLFEIMPRARVFGGTVDKAGAELGVLAKEELFQDVDQFRASVLARGRASKFVEFVLSCRVNRTRRRNITKLLDALHSGSRLRWMGQAIQQAFGMYCMVRQCAIPDEEQPLYLERRLVGCHALFVGGYCAMGYKGILHLCNQPSMPGHARSSQPFGKAWKACRW